jgi:esterase/lipase superfamily enzyme
VKKAFAFAATAFLTLALVGCAGRPSGNLVVVSASAPGASAVDMLVATTRSDNPVAPGVMFNGERAHGLAFADIVVSIPPDETRKVGDVQWPSAIPGDPAHDFVTLRADRLDLKEAKAAFDQRLRTGPSRHVLLFVHGYNTRFEEAVYRFAQITHDSGARVVPVLFTWPSRGKLFDYVYDRESATYSRDGLEAVLQALAKDPNVDSISILAHSMGNFVAAEALRQMAIRNRSLSPKIKDIMLAAPDLDFDVFRREIAEIEASDKNPPVTLFVSQDDYALAASRELAGNEPRLGAIGAVPLGAGEGARQRDRPQQGRVRGRVEPRQVRDERGGAGHRPTPRRRPDLDRRQADARRTSRRRRSRSGRDAGQSGDAGDFGACRDHRSQHARHLAGPSGFVGRERRERHPISGGGGRAMNQTRPSG